MLCNECRKEEATVFLKALVNNKLSQYQLCASCAERKGLELMEQPASLLSTLLAQLAGLRLAPAMRGRPSKCPGCGRTSEDFRRTGRLGCARCYETFETLLSHVLVKVHGARQHVGKAPAPAPTQAIALLEERLRQALSREDFESAALLRDEIRQLRGGRPAPGKESSP